MAEIPLVAYERPFVVPVRLGNGRQIQMNVKANEAFHDEKGYIRVFSMRFNDGGYGNFKLLPNNQAADVVVRICKNFIVDLGFEYVRGVIKSGNEVIDNIAEIILPIVEQQGRLWINDMFEEYSIANSSYYAIDNGELVIAEPVRLRV